MSKAAPLSDRSRRALLLAPALIFLAVFFVMPLLDNSARSFLTEEGGLTFARYTAFLTDRFYLGVIAETVILSAAVTVISVLIAYPVA